MPYAGLDYVPSCPEQDRLVDDLDETATQYAHAVGDLVTRMGTMQEPAYSIAKASVDIARQRAEDARQTLLKHREEHGC